MQSEWIRPSSRDDTLHFNIFQSGHKTFNLTREGVELTHYSFFLFTALGIVMSFLIRRNSEDFSISQWLRSQRDFNSLQIYPIFFLFCHTYIFHIINPVLVSEQNIKRCFQMMNLSIRGNKLFDLWMLNQRDTWKFQNPPPPFEY